MFWGKKTNNKPTGNNPNGGNASVTGATGASTYQKPQTQARRPPPPHHQPQQQQQQQPQQQQPTQSIAHNPPSRSQSQSQLQSQPPPQYQQSQQQQSKPSIAAAATTTAAASIETQPGAGDGDDLFGGLEIVEENAATTSTEPSLVSSSVADKENPLSVDVLSKLSETEQLTLAFQMSMKETQPGKNLINSGSRKSVIDSPEDENTAIEQQGSAVSGFGFMTNGTNAATETNSVGGGSGFNFIESGAEPGMPQAEERHINDDEPATDAQEDMFAQVNMANQLPTKNPGLEERASVESSVSVSLPPESTHSPDMSNSSARFDSSIMGQVRRAQKDYERAENRSWNALKATLDKESRTKQEINQLQRKLEEEQEKSKNAAQLKTLALQKNSFEEADKQKSIITRCETACKDIHVKLQKLQTTLQTTRKEKLRYEKELIRKAEEVQQKLQALYQKHEEAMQTYSREENERIEREEQQVSNTLSDVQEQIELNRREKEKHDESLERIEETIINETGPVQTVLKNNKSKRDALAEEVAELLKQVAEKQEQIRGIDESIASLEDEVQKIRDNYTTEITQISKEKQTLQITHDKLQNTTTELNNKQTDLERQKDNAREVEEGYQQELHSIQNYMEKATETLQRLQQNEERLIQWEQENTQLRNAMAQTQTQLNQIINKKNTIQSDLKKIEAKAAQHREVVQVADETLPTLLSQKSLAVAEENYKEAGKLHTQIQTKTDLRKKSLAELEQLSQDRITFETQYNEALREEKEFEQEIRDYQSKIDYSRFCLLQDQKTSLEAALSQISETTNDTGAAMKVTNDVEKSVLSQELKECTDEMACLSKQYGWTDYNYKNASTKKTNKESENSANQNHEEDVEEAKQEPTKSYTPTSITKEKAKAAAPTSTPLSKEELTAQLANERKQLETINERIKTALETDDYETAGKLKPQKESTMKKIAALQKELDSLPQDSSILSDQNGSVDNQHTSNDANETKNNNEIEEIPKETEETPPRETETETPQDHAKEDQTQETEEPQAQTDVQAEENNDDMFAGMAVASKGNEETEDID